MKKAILLVSLSTFLFGCSLMSSTSVYEGNGVKITFPCSYKEFTEPGRKAIGCGNESYQYMVEIKDETSEGFAKWKAASKKGAAEDASNREAPNDISEFAEQKTGGYESFTYLTKRGGGEGPVNISKILYVFRDNKLIEVTGRVISDSYTTPKSIDEFFNSLELE